MMTFRIRFSRFLLQLGSFIQSLPVIVMRPDDLVEFSRQNYAKSHVVGGWADDELVDSGLGEDELALLKAIPTQGGDLLLLGLGGGRDAIALAKIGYRVTGLDYVADMVHRARENAARRGIEIAGLVQEISRLDIPPSSFNLIWLSREMYSCVPTRARRVDMVKRIAKSLKPGGFFLCQYHRYDLPRISKLGLLLRRLIAFCTLGNLGYEEGDTLWYNIEFVHVFSSEDGIHSELEEGGLSVIYMRTDTSSYRAGAVCQKCPETA